MERPRILTPPDPTDEQALTATPERPRRGKLHGADDPHGYFANRFASIRTVVRRP